jgi:hypothetical protein
MSIVDDAIEKILADKREAQLEAARWKAEALMLRSIRQQQEELGLTDRNNHALRVRWVNFLRKLVDKRMPLNKMGSPMTTDVDVLLATEQEHLEVLKTLYEKRNTETNGTELNPSRA